MFSLLFVAIGAYLILNKDVRVSSKSAIKGRAAQILGLFYLYPVIPFLMVRVSEPVSEPIAMMALVINLVGFVLMLLATIVVATFFRTKI
jgi:hypothetical protein